MPGPARAVSRRKMPAGLACFHWCMIVCTCGLWLPVYLSARRRRTTVTSYQYPQPPAYPPPGQYPPPYHQGRYPQQPYHQQQGYDQPPQGYSPRSW
jgi:hypothetical protein